MLGERHEDLGAQHGESGGLELLLLAVPVLAAPVHVVVKLVKRPLAEPPGVEALRPS